MKERVLTALGIIGLVLLSMAFGEMGLLALIFVFILVASYEVFDSRKLALKSFMAPFIILCVFIGGLIPYDLFMVFLAIYMFILFLFAVSFEWFEFDDLTYLFMMVSILVFAVQSLRITLSYGMIVFAYVLIANFATDTFAYFGGYFFGKHKLNERISPKKTIEGSVVGYVMSAIVSLIFAYVFLGNMGLPFVVYIVSSLSIPFVSQIGDLAFSLVKRQFSIKDFGSIFPGHGGVLDRIDSVIFSLIVFNIILLIFA